MPQNFTSLLLSWNKKSNKREMPWKGEKDPYKVWLSEVILQQTRVEQGLPYYEKFIKTFPGIQHLANAKDEDVFKLWEGLGYYSRCRNLLHTARIIANEFDGKFPNDYKDILMLKGVGPYTAAAIASFCFNQQHAVVDGNVIRVLARVYGIKKSVTSAEGKKYFEKIAQENLDKKSPGIYNQSIMDFGATFCKPQSPLCSACVMNNICIAFKKNKIDAYPVKEKAIVKKERWFNYFIFKAGDKIFIRQRTEKDIWQGLHEYFLHESGREIKWSEKTIVSFLKKETSIYKPISVSFSKAKPQQLTHQLISGYFIEVKLNSIPSFLKNQYGQWVSADKLSAKAFPKFINSHHYMC